MIGEKCMSQRKEKERKVGKDQKLASEKEAVGGRGGGEGGGADR